MKIVKLVHNLGLTKTLGGHEIPGKMKTWISNSSQFEQVPLQDLILHLANCASQHIETMHNRSCFYPSNALTHPQVNKQELQNFYLFGELCMIKLSNAGVVESEMHCIYSLFPFQNVLLPRFVSPCFMLPAEICLELVTVYFYYNLNLLVYVGFSW